MARDYLPEGIDLDKDLYNPIKSNADFNNKAIATLKKELILIDVPKKFIL